MTSDALQTFTASWGPHLCPSCKGVGWLRHNVPWGDPNFGQLCRCEACAQADHRLFARLWEASDLDPNASHPPSFESFDLYDDASEAMLLAAMEFSAKPQGWLTIHGRGSGRANRGSGHWGAGKSHLAEAIARTLLQSKIPAIYVTAPHLFGYLGARWREDGDSVDYDRRLKWMQDVQVVVIDELNREPSSLATERLRFDLLDSRYRKALQQTGGATVLVSNDHPDYWQDPAIASRASDGRFVTIIAPNVDFRRVVENEKVKS